MTSNKKYWLIIKRFIFLVIPLFLAGLFTSVAAQENEQATDENGAPLFQVDPFWPGPLPNRWSMQQVTGIHVDHLDHIWFLNRGNGVEGDEIGGSDEPPRIDCCVRSPELIEMDKDGNVLNAWGGPGFHSKWPTALQTVIADREGFVWIGGTQPQDSILKFTRDGELVWDFDHRPPIGVVLEEDNTQTDVLANKGRFQLDQDAREIYIINWKRVLVYDMDTGEFKRGWGGHGMGLDEISNDPIPGYEWNGQRPPEELNFVPDLHFLEISRDGLVYIGERGQNRIQVFQKNGTWVKNIYVAESTPGQRLGVEECGGVGVRKELPPCGSMYKLVISKDPTEQYLYMADGTNNRVWIVDRHSGETLGSFGGNGRYAGQLHWINAIGIDTEGNIYTGEVEHAKRIQKFTPVRP
ncbi:MAG: hypothetical protein CMM56_10755 [Rhodospirillaceae bacterium]|nr:hypothetical protein [Rhodospirillaceae bacterium]|tara:strand:- start:2673 stop:3899 length:1227 start_codon:yes stop_codon:yes gene_type:complete